MCSCPSPSDTYGTQCHPSALVGPSQPRVTTLASSPPFSVSAAEAVAVKDLNEPLVDATIGVYLTITSQLLPTPAKSHYTFNLRDLSKVFQGMLMAEPSKVEVSPPISTAVHPVEDQNSSSSSLIDRPANRPQLLVEATFWYSSMNVVAFSLAILPSTHSKEILLPPPQPFLVEADEWPQGVNMTQAVCSGLDGAIGDQAGDHVGTEALSCYQLVAMMSCAPSALLRTLLWLQPSQ